MDQRSTKATAKPQRSKNQALFQFKLCGSFAHRKGSHYFGHFSSSLTTLQHPPPTFQLNRPKNYSSRRQKKWFHFDEGALGERDKRGGDHETRGKIKAEKGVGHRGEIVREGGEERKQSRAPWSRSPKPRQHRRSRNPQTSLPPSHLPRTLLSHHPAPPTLSKMCFSCIWSVFPLTDLPRV